ncbi:sigma 54-interacting transcriptional regulator [Pseudenhygromyxa sp. WMMC2535]|uniref:sigma 54-interacting transcriptional regulator n=1 Tax=Pseudenhygromyxa sp. WMMC2535 TaxID=2712867 RepID=UPI0015525C98|nr:sigma 54-interacting transcriptional regulator [Pseudenhygromyxa sp. WMMC2535]NVB36851.1 sigma 54-interacting transcriptional regulator [Pseudenhygromyxa sp. WMMC2535]
MHAPRIPKDEVARLTALESYEILDTAPEENFDDLVTLAAHVADTPAALISFVDADRQWFKASHGVDMVQTPRELSFCGHVVATGQSLVVEDAREDARFCDNPLVCDEPHVAFYAGLPLITPEGHVLGTLCVLDHRPHVLGPEQLTMLRRLAHQAMDALELRRYIRRVEHEQRALVASEQRLALANRLATAVTTAQRSFILGEPLAAVCERMLEHFLELSDSSFGLIGEIRYDAEDAPYLRTHAITNIAWDPSSREFVGAGLEFRNLDTLLGATLRTGAPVLANDPANDPRRGSLPPGHPPLHAYLGLPVAKGDKLLGMVGLANRAGGYDEAMIDFLQPLLATYAGLLEACRAEARRQASTQALSKALSSLRQSNAELTSFLDLLSVGTMVISPGGEILHVSESCSELAGVEAHALGRQWTRALPVDERACAALQACLTLPEAERSRIGARLRVHERLRYVEIDVRDDPRSPTQHVFFIYDVSEVYQRTREPPSRADHGLIGASEAMRRVHDAIEQVAAGTWTVLVEGETGTGKELVARAIHEASARRHGPFVTVNCAGLTDTLLGSQLFGHIKGAFTGATSDRPGLFEAAEGGSIFLDEIGDISLTMQRALLRVLQEREVTRVGETRPRKVDVRIIAATHRDIQAMSGRGEFREDLLYRIRIARIFLPPLRERREDIPALIQAFLADEHVTAGKQVCEVDPVALELLMQHSWPGNVRELRGIIEHAVVRCRGVAIRPWDLPRELEAGETPSESEGDDAERDKILAALRQTGGNRSKAARLLGIARATLYRRLESLDI